jgi:hypothetical protein
MHRFDGPRRPPYALYCRGRSQHLPYSDNVPVRQQRLEAPAEAHYSHKFLGILPQLPDYSRPPPRSRTGASHTKSAPRLYHASSYHELRLRAHKPDDLRYFPHGPTVHTSNSNAFAGRADPSGKSLVPRCGINLVAQIRNGSWMKEGTVACQLPRGMQGYDETREDEQTARCFKPITSCCLEGIDLGKVGAHTTVKQRRAWKTNNVAHNLGAALTHATALYMHGQ